MIKRLLIVGWAAFFWKIFGYSNGSSSGSETSSAGASSEAGASSLASLARAAFFSSIFALCTEIAVQYSDTASSTDSPAANFL